MDPQLLGPIVSRYNDIRKQDIRVSDSWNIWNSAARTNSSWVDVFEELLYASNKDMMKSANPRANLIGTQLTTDRLFESVINDNYFFDTADAKRLQLQTIYSAGIDQIDGISNLLRDDLAINTKYDQFVAIQDESGYTITHSIYDIVDIAGLPFIEDYAKSSYLDPYNVAAGSFQKLHNLFGTSKVDFVYPSLALNNAYSLKSALIDEYRSYGLVSPNKGLFGSIAASVDFSFSLDFFDFGVRNDYGELPVIAKFYLAILVNSANYFSSNGEYLLEYAYGQLSG